MSILKQKLHRKNDAGTYDEIHLATDGSVVTMNNGGLTVEAAINNNCSLISNLSSEVSSLKTSVSNGKSAVASAITDKGVSTSATASFSTMASNIRKLSKPLTVPVVGSNFTYSGSYQVIDDGSSKWRIKFLTSGTFKPLQNMVVDIFLVGGGGGSFYEYGNGSGGGGGYTKTSKSITLYANTNYSIVIGAGGTSDTKSSTESGAASNGGKSSGFGIEVNGGSGGNSMRKDRVGGDGGSGGGAYYSSGMVGYSGGSNGSNGGGITSFPGGTGQGSTTREFGESSGDLYAGGGGGKYDSSIGTGGAGGGANGGYAAAANTGGGGGGGGNGSLSDGYGGHGGSGIVIIRNKR